MALWTRAAATAESTPPDRAQSTGEPSPPGPAPPATCDSMIEVWVHDGGQWQTS